MRLESSARSLPSALKSTCRGQMNIYIFIGLISYLGPVVHGNPINRQAGISENVYITVQNDTYGIEQRVCSIDSMTYDDGESIPTSSPCEHCICRPPGFACTIISCEYRPGCKSLKRSDQCCPEYQCECEANGKIYQNGEKILDDNNPCEVCYCQGGDVICAVIDCYWRSDCQPRYIENRCCPLYDHCPPPSGHGQTRPTQAPTTVSTTTFSNPISWLNMSSAIYATPSTTRKSFISSTLIPPTAAVETNSNNVVEIGSSSQSALTSEVPNSIPTTEGTVNSNIPPKDESHVTNIAIQSATLEAAESVSQQSITIVPESTVKPQDPPVTSQEYSTENSVAHDEFNINSNGSSEVSQPPTPVSTVNDGGPLETGDEGEKITIDPTELTIQLPPSSELSQIFENKSQVEISSDSPTEISIPGTSQATMPEGDLGVMPIQSNPEIILPGSLTPEAEVIQNPGIAQNLTSIVPNEPIISNEQSRPELLEIGSVQNSPEAGIIGESVPEIVTDFTKELNEATNSLISETLPIQSTSEFPPALPSATTTTTVLSSNEPVTSPVSAENELYDNTVITNTEGQQVADPAVLVSSGLQPSEISPQESNKSTSIQSSTDVNVTLMPTVTSGLPSNSLNNRSDSAQASSAESSTSLNAVSPDASLGQETHPLPISVPIDVAVAQDSNSPVDTTSSESPLSSETDGIIFSDDNSKPEPTPTNDNPTTVPPAIFSDDAATLSSIDNSGNILEELPPVSSSTTFVGGDAEESPTSTSAPSKDSLEGQEPTGIPLNSSQENPPTHELEPVGTDATNGADEIISTSLDTKPAEALSQIKPAETGDENQNLVPEFPVIHNASSHQLIPIEDIVADANLNTAPTEIMEIGGITSKPNESSGAGESSNSAFVVGQPVLDIEETLPQSDASLENLVTQLPETFTTSAVSISESSTLPVNTAPETVVIESNHEEIPVFDENVDVLPNQNPQEDTTKAIKEESPSSAEIFNHDGHKKPHSDFPDNFLPPNLSPEQDAVVETTVPPPQEKFRLDLSIFSDDDEKMDAGTESPVAVTDRNLYPEKDSVDDDVSISEKVIQDHHIPVPPPTEGVYEDGKENLGSTDESPVESNTELGLGINTTHTESEVKANRSKVHFGIEYVKKVNPISDDIETEELRSDLRSDAENEVSADSNWYWRTLDRMRSFVFLEPSPAKSLQKL